MGRCCALIFGLLGVLAMLNGIAANVIGYYTCWYMTPYNVNNSPYTGYYKYCCTYQNAPYWNCLPHYTIYNGPSIAAISISWGLCFIFFVIAGCCRRRAARR